MIVHGNVIELARTDRDFRRLLKSVDVGIHDPPYSAHVHEAATSTRTGGVGPRSRDLKFGPLTPDLRDFIAESAGNWTARWTIVFADLEGCHDWRVAMALAGAEYVREVPCGYLPHYWHRWSQPQISGDRPPTGAEAILAFHRMTGVGPRGGARRPIKKQWNGPGGRTMYDARAMRGEDKHPTEKPLDLCLMLVSDFSRMGELVGDYTTGRGSIPLACRLLGRRAIGVEVDESEARLASMREASALTPRDQARALEWCEKTEAEARTVPAPEDPSMVPTFKRAKRRLRDVQEVRSNLAA
jgi:DNA methylase